MIFGFEKGDIQRMMVSALGALALSATCIGAAVGPVRAANPIASHVHQFVAK